MVEAAIWLFWAAFALTGYTYVGYPAVVGVLARLFGLLLLFAAYRLWPRRPRTPSGHEAG